MCMIQLVWLAIGFQIFIAFILSYKLFIPSSSKVVFTENSAFKSSSKTIQEQTAASVISSQITEKNKSRKR